MVIKDEILFNPHPLHDILYSYLQRAKEETDKVSKEQFQANTNDQVSDFVFASMEIVPITLHLEQTTRSEPKETRMPRRNTFGDDYEANAVEIKVTVPYSGESNLWEVLPSRYTLNPPQGSIQQSRVNDQSGTLVVTHIFAQQEFLAEKVNDEIDRNLNSIQSYLSYIKSDIENHNKQLKDEITRQVQLRRERLGAIQEQAKSIKIPLHVQDGIPKATELIIPKRKIPVLGSKKAEPEYSLSDVDYDSILDVIRHEGATFERMPETFAVHDEEELRDFVLAHLNGHFKGQATGETFRKKGKTDILIEVENRAAFVAECKLWKGDKTVNDAINQLLDYLTWRDVKTALILYNKTVAGFKSIQEKMVSTLQTQGNVLDVGTLNGTTEWKARLRSKDDPERVINLRVFLFNLYISKK